MSEENNVREKGQFGVIVSQVSVCGHLDPPTITPIDEAEHDGGVL